MTAKRRAEAQMWRPDEPAHDTAPTWAPDRPSLDAWGVSQDEARAMLERQMCPACGEGPWKSPLTHVAKRHGIDRFTMRDVCGLTTTISLVDPEFRERLVERGRATDMTAASEAARRRRKQRFTEAGRQQLSENLAAWERGNPEEAKTQRRAAAALTKTPEAQAKRSATLRAKWAAMTSEDRRSATSIPTRDPEEQREVAIARWDKEGRRPCGTRASYRRGCRCNDCREAYLAYRRARG